MIMKIDGAVPASTLKEAMGKPEAVAVDVREEDEYRYEHISGARNVPLSRFSALAPALPHDKDLYVFCQSGVRSLDAARILKDEGFPRVFTVEGGLEAWRSAGYPIERRKGPIPIMRQVQIITGFLAFIGGLFVSLRWVAIFIGAGLMFAGISGKCGLAMILSKLPWNRSSGEEKPSSSCSPCAR
jgi:rhodanese-related sulfurtransferase